MKTLKTIAAGLGVILGVAAFAAAVVIVKILLYGG